MLKRLYLFILFSFAVFMLLLNVATFLTGFSTRQLINVFYVPERAVASMMFFEHIIFESGLVLKSVEDSEVEQSVIDACKNTMVDPSLVMFMIEHGASSPYAINTDGSIGLLRVKAHMLEKTLQTDLFTLNDNIKTGVEYLAALMQESYGVKNALENYYAPSSKTIFTQDVAKMLILSEKVYSEYENSIRRSSTDIIPSMLQDETAELFSPDTFKHN